MTYSEKEDPARSDWENGPLHARNSILELV